MLVSPATIEPTTYAFYLPVVSKSQPLVELGGYMWGDVTQRSRADYLVPGQWVKWDIDWGLTELERGVYAWTSEMDNNAAYYKYHGYNQLINVQHVPAWARIYPDIACSPPKPEYVDEWVSFLHALRTRYQPEAIELWNEPEATTNSGAFWATCFGDMPGYYAEVVTYAVDNLKPVFPNTIFVAGALILGNEQDEAWLADAMASGLHGDVLSFHGYKYNNLDYNNLDYLTAKYGILRSLTDMPLWITETALLSDTDTTLFRQRQAEYLTAAYNLANELNISHVFWYSQNKVGWKFCHMADEYATIKYPVWFEFQRLLNGAE